MVKFDKVQAQLARIGSWPGMMGRPEKKELANILHPDENIMRVVVGWYEGGIALLCATDQRLLLVDKKLMFLNVEDLRYDMIAEVMYQAAALDASLTITCSTKTLTFKSLSVGRLRGLATYIQSRVLELRRYKEAPPAQAVEVDTQPLIDVNPQPAGNLSNFSDYDRWVGSPQAMTAERNPYRASPFRRRRIGGFATLQQLRQTSD